MGVCWSDQPSCHTVTLSKKNAGYAYFQTSGADPSVLLRLKEDYDGAEPAASSVAAINLMRLAALLPNGGGCICGLD